MRHMTEQADNQQPSLDLQRSCRKCGEIKPLSEFPEYRVRKKTGEMVYRRYECKVCHRKYQAAWARGDIKPQYMDSENWKCRNCGEVKPIGEFAKVYSKKNRGKNYRSHTCQECHRKDHADRERKRRQKNPELYREYRKRHYAANRTKLNEQRKAWSHKLRDQVFEAYGGYKCRCCGETERSMLTLDHINNDGGEHRRKSPAMRWAKHMYAWLIEQGFPPILQILCYNCNISKFRNGGVCAHQIKKGSTTIP